MLGAEPAAEHGFAKDFSADDATAGSQGSASAAAAVGGAVVARLKDLKLGERLGSVGDRVLTNFNPGRVLAETVKVPVGILGWQLRFPSGWGPYLCLPLQVVPAAYIYVYTYIYICMCIYVCVCVCVYIYIYYEASQNPSPNA